MFLALVNSHFKDQLYNLFTYGISISFECNNISYHYMYV